MPHVSRVATPFSWSAERLRAAGAQAEWVGHASLENVPDPTQRPELRRKFGVTPDQTLIALLPGSRPSEIRVLASRMAKAAGIIQKQIGATFIAVVPEEVGTDVRRYLPDEIRVVNDCAKELLLASDAAIVKTGTGTLEAVLAGTPQVTVYDLPVSGRIEWLLLWAWRWIPFIAMPNIILQRQVVPELLGLDCNAERMAAELIRILKDEPIRATILRDYAIIRQTLGSDLPLPPTERTAQMVEEMLSETTKPAQREQLAV